MTIDVTLTGARIMQPGGWDGGDVALCNGVIADAPVGRKVDLSGYDVLPGIVDLHGDGFERHMAPRRGALRERDSGVVAVASELAANGITTAVLAQFWSWEGGMRGPDFAGKVFASIAAVKDTVAIDLRQQLRFETHCLDDIPAMEQMLEDWGIDYVVFNDHLPHERLAAGKKPPRLTGQALKSQRNPEEHLRLMLELHNQSADVPAAMNGLCARLKARGVRMGSHDDHFASQRADWRARGATLSEFPETLEAAEAGRSAGDGIILGAPNVVRGSSHAGNASAQDLIAAGCCDALASDYHYPSPARAAWRCVEKGLVNEAEAWAMVSSGPARLLGLSDRGEIRQGLRGDLVVMEPETRRIAAVIAGGQVAYMSGPVGARFFGHPS